MLNIASYQMMNDIDEWYEWQFCGRTNGSILFLRQSWMRATSDILFNTELQAWCLNISYPVASNLIIMSLALP